MWKSACVSIHQLLRQNYSLYILNATFVGTKQENNRFWAEWWQVSPNFNQFLISKCMKLLFVSVVFKNSNSSKCSNEFDNHVLLYCPTVCWQDMNIYLVFSTFTSRSTHLLEE